MCQGLSGKTWCVDVPFWTPDTYTRYVSGVEIIGRMNLRYPFPIPIQEFTSLESFRRIPVQSPARTTLYLSNMRPDALFRAPCMPGEGVFRPAEAGQHSLSRRIVTD
eukprot:501455-Amorphochlora_amoeboformis.AAC.1